MREPKAGLAALDGAIVQGLADANADRIAAADAVFDRLEEKYRAMVEGEG